MDTAFDGGCRWRAAGCHVKQGWGPLGFSGNHRYGRVDDSLLVPTHQHCNIWGTVPGQPLGIVTIFRSLQLTYATQLLQELTFVGSF